MSDLQVTQTDKTLTLSKVFNAPRERVFEMFKNPEHLAKWWGPTTWPATIVAFDFVPGGIWHYYMQGPDGTKAWGKATFQEIDEPNSLSFVDAFSDEAGNIDESLPTGVSTVTFSEQDDQTLLTIVGEWQTAAELDKVVNEMGMLDGMRDTLGQLERLLEQ